MTVYARNSRGFEESVEVFAYDHIPLAIFQVWEVNEGTHWVRNSGDVWLAVGEDDSLELTTEELLDEFGPVTDDEEEVESCPICGVGGCAGHARRPSDVLTGGAQ